MSTTEQRLAANRANALNSTGPTSAEGKAIASQNATRHGLLSTKLFLEDENPAEFQSLFGGLWHSLIPVGALEASLVERIAVTLWRQRRLVHAETATLTLARQPRYIAGSVSSELGRSYGSEIKEASLTPFDSDQEQWCRKVIEEIDRLGEIDVRTLEQLAPHVFAQLKSNAEEDHEDVASHVESFKGGITGYVSELLVWCHEQLKTAEQRPRVLALAEQVRAKRLVLPKDTLELLSRYQTTLDNQLYKSLKALREAQEWRLKTIELAPPSVVDEVADAA